MGGKQMRLRRPASHQKKGWLLARQSLAAAALLTCLCSVGCIGAIKYSPNSTRLSNEAARQVLARELRRRVYCASSGNYIKIGAQIAGDTVIFTWPSVSMTVDGHLAFASGKGKRSFIVPLATMRFSSIYEEMATYKVYFNGSDLDSGAPRGLMVLVMGPWVFPYISSRRAYELADAITTLSGRASDDVEKYLNE